MSDIPEKGELIQLMDLRIDRNAGKVCKCQNARRILNHENRQVYCEQCGALVDPFDALMDFAYKMKRDNKKLIRMSEQAKELSNYKPWLKVIRKLEKDYRGKKMLPNCPRCETPFYLEELTHWTGREYADARIAKHKREHGE